LPNETNAVGHNRQRAGTATILVSPVDFNEGRSAQRCFPLVRQQAGISALSSAGARGAKMPPQSTTISELMMNRLNTLFPVTRYGAKDKSNSGFRCPNDSLRLG
jgi:hypothetical protein